MTPPQLVTASLKEALGEACAAASGGSPARRDRTGVCAPGGPLCFGGILARRRAAREVRHGRAGQGARRDAQPMGPGSEILGAITQGETLEEAPFMLKDAVPELGAVRREEAEREYGGNEVVCEPLRL